MNQKEAPRDKSKEPTETVKTAESVKAAEPAEGAVRVSKPDKPKYDPNDFSYRRALIAPDGFAVGNKHPTRAYRFVSKPYLDKSGGFDRRGWQPITAQNSMGECLTSPYGNFSQGTDIRNGDLVLAFMPKEFADMKRAALQDRQAEQMKASLANIRQKAADLDMDHVVDVQVGRVGKNEQQSIERF